VTIHPTAIIGDGAAIDESAVVGAYCVIEPESADAVCIGRNVVIGHHTVITGRVAVADGTVADPFTRLGPRCSVGRDCKLLYGARLHDRSFVGDSCVIAGNVPDNTQIGNRVVHLGKIAHSLYYPFADLDEPAEPGPRIEDEVVICTDALLIGPITVGANSMIFPREVVRINIPPGSVFRNGRAAQMPNWRNYLRALGASHWVPGVASATTSP
jgi:serine acetyltransferase